MNVSFIRKIKRNTAEEHIPGGIILHVIYESCDQFYGLCYNIVPLTLSELQSVYYRLLVGIVKIHRYDLLFPGVLVVKFLHKLFEQFPEHELLFC